MNTTQAQVAKAIEKAVGSRIVADQGVAFRIRYVGTPESAAGYADAVLVSATSLTLSVNGVADSTVGASGVVAFATYTTLGAVVDAINLSSNWQAEIVAGLRSDAVNGSELLARSTSTFRPFVTVELPWDSSDGGVLGLDVLLEPGEAFGSADRAVQHKVGLTRVIGLVNTSGGESINITAYELKPDKAAVFKTLATFIAADNTEKDSGATEVPLVEAGFGNSILVRFRGTGWVDSGAYLGVLGTRF